MGRILVLLAGLAGAAAFFLPLIEIEVNDRRAGISTLHVMRGVRGMEEAVGEKVGDSEAERRKLEELEEGLRKVQGIFLAFFVPAAALLLIGLLTRVGRGMGIVALVVAVIGFGGWALMSFAIGEAARKNPESGSGIAVTLLLASALLGIVGGIWAIARPGGPRAPGPAGA